MTPLTILHRVLAHSRGYDRLQRALGGDAARRFVDDLLRPAPASRILDLGCGTARILDWLPDSVAYVGVDASPRYIAEARRRYGGRATFLCGDIVGLNGLPTSEPHDLVLVKGVLHHLDDRAAMTLVDVAHAQLKPAGELVTIDPVLHEGQARAARLLIGLDRGQHVRRPEQYRVILERRFSIVEARLLTGRLRVPYSHFFMRARR